MRHLIVLAFAATAGCGNTGRDPVTIPLYLAGSDVSEPFLGVDDALITLDRADLAFGPLYLCAGFQAGELCDTARAEWLESAVVLTTTDEPRRAGQLVGVSGAVRSWMYDLGITSLLTQSAPLVLRAADGLGGVSLALEGRVEIDGRSVAFRADIPIQQQEETEIGVPVVRKSSSDDFEHELLPGEPGLLIRFDPRPWLTSVDFHDAVASWPCAAEPACETLQLEAESQGYRSIRNALVAGERPTFTWGFAP